MGLYIIIGYLQNTSVSMIYFLHLIKDDKFFESTVQRFSNMSNISSEYVLYNPFHRSLKYVKKNVLVYSRKKDIKRVLCESKYDVIYLHSLPVELYPIIKYIPSDKIVIWWAWGYDLYSPGPFGIKDSFINIHSFLPLTQKQINKCYSFRERIKYFVAKKVMEIVFPYYKKKILQRVDYFQPVLQGEFMLMKFNKGFHAHEFYTTSSNSPLISCEKRNQLNKEGSIIIGNSASPYNNHIDVWKEIKSFIPKDRQIIVPLSYGEKKYGDTVKKVIMEDNDNALFLEKYIPNNEYMKLLGECSYAVYGSLRQHATGNIFNALAMGIKVFLPKQSYFFKWLIKNDFTVFSIESIDETSFVTPLSVPQIHQNYIALEKMVHYMEDKGRMALIEIEKSKLK